MNNAVLKETPQVLLQRKLLLLDGNAHCPISMPVNIENTISEALLPEIRTIACLIAASRWKEHTHSPDVFTDKADWFAARMLVLNIHRLEINPHDYTTLKSAISRAKVFAKKHQKFFRQPEIRIVLHQEHNDICPIWVEE